MTSFWAADVLSGIPRYAMWLVVISLIVLIVFFAAYLNRPQPFSAGVRQVAGSRIALGIGDRFTPSDRFTGFVHDASGASVALVELPSTAFDQLQRLGNAAQTFAAQGIANVTEQPLPGRSGEYMYLRGEQKTALVDYVKYILIFRERGLTGMVTANIPRVALTTGLLKGIEIESVLKSAQIQQDAPVAPALFSLGYIGPFEEDTSLLGTTKGYRLKTTGTEKPAFKPIFLVAPSLTQAPIPDLAYFAERSFDGIDQIRDKIAETTASIEISGLKAVEISGKGLDSASQSSAIVYQLIIEAPHGGYFRILGLAPETEFPQFTHEFMKMGRSFRLQ